jgi:hypothetical protein
VPYDPDNPPSKVKGLSKNKQRQFVEVFNSCWSKNHDEGKCHAMAWGVAKKAAAAGGWDPIWKPRMPSKQLIDLSQRKHKDKSKYDRKRQKQDIQRESASVISPLDMERLAARIERLMAMRTDGWHPADEMEFRKALPGGRGYRTLPEPSFLREVARAQKMAGPREEEEDEDSLGEAIEDWRMWISLALDMEGLASRNDPRNPRRMMRDMARGKFPGRFGGDDGREGRFVTVEAPPEDPLEMALGVLEGAFGVNSNDGGVNMARKRRIIGYDRELVARELAAAARDLIGAEPGFMEEARALKMKGYVDVFSKSIGKFRHDANEFVKNMMDEVRNPRALAGFPYLKAILKELQDQKTGVLPMTFVDDASLKEMLTRVVCEDTGKC